MNSETKFTHVGRSYTGEKETAWNKTFDELEWQDIPCTLPFMQGEGIKGMIHQLNLPPAMRVAWTTHHPAQDCYALLAAEFKTPTQHFQVFALDKCDTLVPLAVRDFKF